MEVAVHEIGRSRSKVLVVDDFLTHAQGAVDAAAALPAFPLETRTAYPGRRYQIKPWDKASSFVVDILRTAGPLIQSHFEADNFTVFEASFSLVTTRPQDLSPKQSVPHYDWADPNYLAIMLHLHNVPDTGTAFYRHVASGFEQISREKVPDFQSMVQAELAEGISTPANSGESANAHYDKIFQVDGCFNRLVVYQGCLLHAGFFSQTFDYSANPRAGRLTANVFIQTAKGGG